MSLSATEKDFLLRGRRGTEFFTVPWSMEQNTYAALPRNAHRIRVPLDATTASQNVFIADAAARLVSAEAVFSTASSSGTLMLQKCTGTQAPGSGTDMLASTMSLAGDAETIVTGTLHATPGNYGLVDGNRIAIEVGGTMTSLAGGHLEIVLALGARINDYIMYIAPTRCKLLSLTFAADDWQVASPAGTIDVKKSVHLQNPGSGTSVLDAAIDIAADMIGPYDTHTPVLVASPATRTLGAGDRLAIDLSDDAKPAGLSAIMEFQRLEPV